MSNIIIDVDRLKADKTEGSYYFAWQSNIAMSILDEMDTKNYILGRKPPPYVNPAVERDEQLNFCNNCAIRFLDMLIAIDVSKFGLEEVEDV